MAARGVLTKPVLTADKRYLIVRGRLWRTSNPNLTAAAHGMLVKQLMGARRAVREALRVGDAHQLAAARQRVNAAKISLGERGPPWWSNGDKDYNRFLIKNTPYG